MERYRTERIRGGRNINEGKLEEPGYEGMTMNSSSDCEEPQDGRSASKYLAGCHQLP